MSADAYAQKRLACYGCRDKKLRCNTLRGETCDRCCALGLLCQRPLGKRMSRHATVIGSSPHLDVRSLHDSARRSASPRPRRGGSTRVRPSRASSSTSCAEQSVALGASAEEVLRPLDSAEHLFWSTLGGHKSGASAFAFSELLDSDDADLDPIRCGVVTTRTALELFDRFGSTFGRSLAYFDERVCTFDYLRARSHALLSVICLIMARAEPHLASLVDALERHVHGVVYPALLVHGYCSVEIVQALLMLAAFEPPSAAVREDRSWRFLSHASRVASEINLQACMTEAADADEPELVVLRRRHAQRAWINLWLHEFSLAQHTGRQSMLSEQDLFKACGGWHLDRLACYTDTALVAMVELRTIIKRNRNLFRLLQPGNERFYAQHCKHDLDSWSQKWSRASSSTSMPRLELWRLYVGHALVQLLGLVLHHQAPSDWMPEIVMELYEGCGTYLEEFPRKLAPDRLRYSYNSMWVAVSYQVVVALRLVQLSWRFSFVDRARLVGLCRGAQRCAWEAAQQSHSGAAAHRYARFLHGVLETLPRETDRDEESAASTFGASAAAVPIGGESDCAVELAAGCHGAGDGMSALGFDDLELFAWAAASCVATDDVHFLI